MNFSYRTRTLESPFYDVFKDTFNTLNDEASSSSYPFADVYINEKDNKLNFDIALAGYKKEDIKIGVKENILTVSFEKAKNLKDEENDDDNITFIENRIAHRNFEKKWIIGGQVNVQSGKASFEDGILNISFDVTPKEVTNITIE